ncbi:substrate-binding periplasmic protein [Vogesella oryzae]|uniref:substrate-binding periplasmic protein n=1 Tax=Vogesella oryzae TaxID=1735285 RepID=UPI0015816FED|nr:transporter substrate-binding domain-containing protein [Vogesella oryzae]
MAASKLLRLLLLLALPAGAAVPVRVLVNDQPAAPYITGEGPSLASPPGLAVELLQQAATSCNVNLQLQRQSSLRQLQALRSGAADAILLLSYNAERAAFAHYPLRDGKPDSRYRLATLSYSFFVRKGSKLQWDGEHLLGLDDGKVGTDLGWSVASDLMRKDIAVEGAVGVEANLAKLRAGRIAAYAVHNTLAEAYLQGSHDVVALQPAISTKDYFLPFSRRFAAEHPQEVQCLWQHIANQREALLLQRGAAYGQ